MSPEQAMGESLDGRTDIFSLGVVAFEMLSGEQPFPGNNVTSILYKLVHADPVRPSNLEVMGMLPDKWHQVFSKVLAKNTADRYGTAAEFVADLERCLGSWFGALESETVVMGPSDTTVVGGDIAEPEPVATAEEGQETTEETVQLQEAELGAATAALPTEAKPPSEEQELGAEDFETVLLSPAGREESASVKTETISSGETPDVTVSDAPPSAPSQGEAADISETETIALGIEESRTASSHPSATKERSEASHVSETIAAQPSESDTTGRSVVPGATRRVKLFGRLWSTGQLALAASIVVGLAVVALLLVFTRGGEPDTISPGPSTPPAPETVPIMGTLSIQSTPEGATVWIDGEEQGVTPLERSDLELGGYVIRVEMKGYKSAELTAELNDENPSASLEVPLEKVVVRPSRAILDIESTPAGAEVLIDGRSIGNTPVKGFKARPGRRKLLIQKEGFQPWENSFDLIAEVPQSVKATLQPVEEAPPEPVEPPAPEVQLGELVERGPGVNDPECIQCPNPPYPPAANKAGLEGLVELSFIVNELGDVQDIEVVESGGEFFDKPVIDVVKGWKFEPATKQGVPVKVRLGRRFRYRRGR
jgi:TonB family protein